MTIENAVWNIKNWDVSKGGFDTQTKQSYGHNKLTREEQIILLWAQDNKEVVKNMIDSWIENKLTSQQGKV